MSRKLLQSVVGSLLVCVATFVASPASAQSAKVPPTARDVLPLITEQVAVDQGATPTVRYWWMTPSKPAWTESDKLVRKILTDNHVDLVGLSGNVRISKIYRTPNLSQANAAALGSLVGAKRVLVGTISYERKAPVGPLGLERVAARADVSLVSAQTGAAAVLHRFTVQREGFAGTAAKALTKARTATAQALGKLIASTLMRGPGPVGVQTDEKLIALRNAENGKVLEQITQFLQGLDQVDEVRVRWASEGVIALEVNPGKKDAPDAIDYAIRALKNQKFDGFALAPDSQPSAQGLAEFDVSQSDQGQF